MWMDWPLAHLNHQSTTALLDGQAAAAKTSSKESPQAPYAQMAAGPSRLAPKPYHHRTVLRRKGIIPSPHQWRISTPFPSKSAPMRNQIFRSQVLLNRRHLYCPPLPTISSPSGPEKGLKTIWATLISVDSLLLIQ